MVDIRRHLDAIEHTLLADIDEATAATLLSAFARIEARIAALPAPAPAPAPAP